MLADRQRRSPALFPAKMRGRFYWRSLPSHLPSMSYGRSALEPAGEIHGKVLEHRPCCFLLQDPWGPLLLGTS